MAREYVDELPIFGEEEKVQAPVDDATRGILAFDDETDEIAGEEPSFLRKVGDVFTQAGLGALKYLSWPLDVLKLGMIGEGLADVDEIEAAYQRAGKQFDKQQYLRDVFEASGIVPTQEMAEKSFEEVTGISLEPQSEAGKRTRQFAELATLGKGSVPRRLANAFLGAATTQTLKEVGVGEGVAELIGDITSAGAQLAKKSPRQFSAEAAAREAEATKYGLPFLEYMARDSLPVTKGKITRAMQQRLKNDFKLSAERALMDIERNTLPLKRLQDRGVNLAALRTYAYDETRKYAALSPHPMNTTPLVNKIDQHIRQLKALAPSPSHAQTAAIDILRGERDVLAVSKPTMEQVINQHQNYNANVKQLYRRPEFSGREEQVRKAYAFLNEELVNLAEQQGNRHAANAFRAANKINHEYEKLMQTESILKKAFTGDGYNPNKLLKIVNGRDGKFLKRNLGDKALGEIEEIAKYGERAQARMNDFFKLNDSALMSEIRQWGQLAPLVFAPNRFKGVLMGMARPLAQYTQGYLLSRPATRKVFKLTLQHAADGAFQLLTKDFADLEKLINEEWGNIDDFLDNGLYEYGMEKSEER